MTAPEYTLRFEVTGLNDSKIKCLIDKLRAVGLLEEPFVKSFTDFGDHTTTITYFTWDISIAIFERNGSQSALFGQRICIRPPEKLTEERLAKIKILSECFSQVEISHSWQKEPVYVGPFSWEIFVQKIKPIIEERT